jgi:DNA-binding HxlR family transcriptional regulator
MVPNEPGEAGSSESVFELSSRSRRALELLILYALSRGTMRHNRLHREIEGISQKMLTKTLRRLERDGLVGREAYPVIPPKVEYSLTPLGETLIKILAELCRWAEEHIEEVEAARRGYDARERS